MISSLFSLKQLEALIWVADLGSFRKAAKHLNTTQPNISSRIANLETVLDTILMVRDAGSVRLTDKGNEVLLAARKILRDAESIVEIADRTDLVKDRLRLGVTELVACTWLHDYLRQLKVVYPALAVELTVDLSVNLDKELAANSLDLTIQSAPFGSAANGLIELGKYPYVWTAAKSIGVDEETRYSVADLIPHTILTHARHTQAYGQLIEYAEKRSLPTNRFVASNSMASCVPMAMDGMGVAMLPKALIEPQLDAGTLIILNVDWTPRPLEFAARYHSEKVSHYVDRSANLAAEIAKKSIKYLS